jgi:translation initiation factor IF-3
VSITISLWRDLAVVEFMAKSRNPIARILKYFTHKRFKDKTKYERKKDVWKRQIRQGNDI